MSDDLPDDDDDQGAEARLTGREVLARIVPYALRYRRELLQALGLLLAVVTLGLAGPLLLGQVVDVALTAGGQPAPTRPLLLPVAPDREGVLVIALAFVAVVVTGFLLEATLGFLMARVGVDCTLRLKEDLFRHTLTLDPAFYRDYPPGRLIARVESDTEAIKNLFTATALQAFRAGLTFVGIFALMLAFDPRTTLFVAPVVLGLTLATMLFVRLVRGLFREARRRMAALTAQLAEFVQGASIVQAYGYEAQAQARMHAENLGRYRAEARASLLNQAFWGFFAFCEAATAALVIWVGVAKVLDGSLTLGTLIIFLEYVRQAFTPVAMLSEFVSQVQQGFVAAGRVFGILSLRPAAPDPPGALTAVQLREAVRFEDVRFSYDGKVEALRGVSFEVPRGKQVALVGASGGGKSTIVSLLLRFHEPTAGRITLDGVELSTIARAAWRSRVGLVLQEVSLFPGTLGDNLTVFDPTRPPQDVSRACEVVGADGLVRRLPGGLEATLAERGANLSMGERQLVSLARALVHDPDLLVLDEATSAIDPRTEDDLQASLARLLAGRTALIVAHRLATVRRCDEILVVEGGRIVERGTHDALWAREGGAYRRLAALQFPELRAAPAQVVA
ncbi:MAG: ABC transporter ATP-binding protein [Planctomycetota bacterium]|nr:ABC transporter ATP-binding protein [Planctomycetota bacterium]